MYNRYIPQPDGSYRKNRMPEAESAQNHPSSHRKQPPQQGQQQKHDSQPPQQEKQQYAPGSLKSSRRASDSPKHTDAGDFLRKLLPENLDTGDLLIIILMLLMAGDCKEEKNTALLTLALYFFL